MTSDKSYDRMIRRYLGKREYNSLRSKLTELSGRDSGCSAAVSHVRSVKFEKRTFSQKNSRFQRNLRSYELTAEMCSGETQYYIARTNNGSGNVRVQTEFVSAEDARRILSGDVHIGSLGRDSLLRELALNINTEQLLPGAVTECDRVVFAMEKYNFAMTLDGNICCEDNADLMLPERPAEKAVLADTAILTVMCDTQIPSELASAVGVRFVS